MPRGVEGRERLAGARRRFPRGAGASGWLLLFALALVVRALRFGLVATPGGVRFPSGADELYHMRRIWFTVVNFPASLDFDRYLNHPEGAPPIWPPAFDWTIAAAVRGLVGAGDQAAVERVAIWAPPLLGALAVLAAAWLARRAFSPAAGWVTGAWLAWLPAHAGYGSIGEIDHHVAVAGFATLLVAAAMRLAGTFAPARRPRAIASVGAAMAGALLLWPGSLLHVVVVQACLALQLLATRERAEATARARALAAAHALAALLVLPFCLGRRWPDLGAVTPLALSGFQPLWFGAGALVFALLAGLWARSALGAERAPRLASSLGLAALGVGAALLLVPGLAAAVRGGLGWFTPDPFLGVVAELKPLLFAGGRFDAALAHHSFSFWFWAFPLGAAALGWRALREGRADVLMLVAWASAFLVATLWQQRFMDSAGPGFALVLGPAAVLAFGTLRRRFPRARIPLLAAACAAGVVALLPYAPAYRGDLQASLAELRGERLYHEKPVRERRVLERIARWLARSSPPTAGYLDASARPEYGVLSAWGNGHLLRYYGERPMVQDNFGPWGGLHGFESARTYYQSLDEEAAFALATRLGARYVVATERGSGHVWPRRGSLAQRLALRRDREGTLVFAGQRPLAHHRLLFAADDSDLARGGEKPWTVALYEIVPGARVSGAAPAGQAVRFELSVALPDRSPIALRASARADARGRYQIRLPQPSEHDPYRVRAAGETASLTISESDVREGRDLPGPNFGVHAIPTP
jgi:dolichyl-diphosphooligosaccharide--protein glycosyltransferase